MFDEDLIRKWVDNGTINPEQARKMSEDLAEYREEHKSKGQIIAFSVIGTILIGVGAILFVASHWNGIPDYAKTLLLVGSTLGIHLSGYHFLYQKQKYPRLGSALLFLSAIFFGASVFLIAQIYNVNANSHFLVFIWLLGSLPLVYGYCSTASAGLCSLLFFIWGGLLYSENRRLEEAIDILDLFLLQGLALYLVGTLHELFEKVKSAARPYKFIGLQATLLFLFLHTFRLNYEFGKTTPIIYAAIGTLLLILLLPPSLRTRLRSYQTDVGVFILVLLLLGMSLVTGYYPENEKTYMIVFNVIFLGVLIMLLYTGYSSENMGAINTAMFWFIPFIIARYFDFFWEMLPRSLFFIAGGLVMLAISILLERKRRELKARFGREKA
ncbi:hypothetical protein MSMTP_1628 [Methanosarcina sp. MTP4]|uniref:DUF2157 domain-containing protein n=1 Tax=Methanosarcina sp. MTP4 TaxID=1434100 RepID=UPI000615A7B2|nr:DUF2157 domain-containing protein [Methanosarcina sp. MTP4]AKB25097.1 hypothetical protein MSMTP_1628 [Methanosarcina sp. MTP4]